MEIEITVFEWYAIGGIVLEMVGFLFILRFWKHPTESGLKSWKRFQKWYKLFFGKEKYEKRIKDTLVFKGLDEDIRTPRISTSGLDPKVPEKFPPFWKHMKWLGFIFVIIGLSLQIVQMLDK